MSRPGSKRLLLLTLVFALAIPAGGAAFSFWGAGGTGSATGTTGTTTALTLNPGSPTANLYPGGQTNVVTTVDNPNTSIIHINTLSLNTLQGTGGYAVDAPHSSCNLNSLTYTNQTNGGTGWDVPAKVGAINGTLNITLTNALAMSTSAANACQGATLTIYLATS